MPRPIENPAFATTRAYFEAACDAAKAHDDLAAAALAAYGNHGPDVSGCVRDHFPRATKEQLRFLAREASRCMQLAHENRPKRIHETTIRALGREIAARRGSGFYGPTPDFRAAV